MGNKMEVYGSAYIEEEVGVTIEVNTKEICDFIEEQADDEDIELIESAIIKIKGRNVPNTLEYNLKKEIADRIVKNYSLYELTQIEYDLRRD